MNDAATATKNLHRQCVTFRLDAELYGIDVMQVQEVLRVTEVAPVPGAPSYVIGIINLRGNVVTIIDTRQCFGLPSREIDDSTRIVIIEAEKQTIGIVVDSVSEVVDVKPDDVETAPSVGNDDTARYIEGVVSRDKELLILVELNRLLTDDEWSDMSGF